MISFVGMFITGWVELLFATIFTGLCIMIGMAIIDNTNGRTEEIIAEREKKVREYRFAPKKEQVQQIREEKEETLEEWCRRMGWNTPEEEANKVYKALTYEDIKERCRKERPGLMSDYE